MTKPVKVIRRSWQKGMPAWSCPEHFRDEIAESEIVFDEETVKVLKSAVDSTDRIIEAMIKEGSTNG